jgi:hypothetical protein
MVQVFLSITMKIIIPFVDVTLESKLFEEEILHIKIDNDELFKVKTLDKEKVKSPTAVFIRKVNDSF